ncbi:MAG: flagellar filament capping protein FliD [Planctomycetes bacterium]|nr:flagellar filament capping protein FliD [Planctomycetota bacterium]
MQGTAVLVKDADGGIDVAANEATGSDVLSLHDNVLISRLNDGNGVSIRGGLPDLEITFQDGSGNLQIDLDGVSTFADLLQKLNADARLTASVSQNGDRIELTDNTAGGNAFTVFSPVGGGAAEDLGLTATAVNGVITTRRLQGGLKTVLVSSLGGGDGLGGLGQLLITDRSGANTTVDLASAETLDEIVAAIRSSALGAGVEVDVRVNQARNGLVLEDTSGGTGNLVVANDGQNTADKLKLTVNAAVDEIDSGSLDRQVFSEQIKLTDLNNGRGVQQSSFLITDTNGFSGAINLTVLAAETVGDVLDAINSLGIGVTARINETGDGILLVDTLDGAGKITVRESGSGTAATDLGIVGTSVEVDLNGTLTEVIDGSTTVTIEIDADDTLTDLIEKINAANPDVSASIFNEGSGPTPFRLALSSLVSGEAGELLVDTTGVDFQFQVLSNAQDALLLVGSADTLGAGILVSSSDNVFEDVIAGLSLTVKGTSSDPVSVTVNSTDASLVAKADLFVNSYNRLRDKLEDLTFFNAEDGTTGPLFGSSAVLRLEIDLANLITGRFFGAGSIQSLAELGINVKRDGRLELDTQKLRDKFAEDPTAVSEFFTTEDFGFGDKVQRVIDSLAGEDNSLLINRTISLQSNIDLNNERIAFLNERLDRQRDRLLKEFFGIEEAIARLQTSLTAIQSIQLIPPLTARSS